jgi:hypothetical protein
MTLNDAAPQETPGARAAAPTTSSRRLSRRGALIALAAGTVAVFTGAAAVVTGGAPPANVGAEQVARLSDSPPPSPLPSVLIQRGQPAAVATVAPAGLHIAAMDLTTQVDAVGIDDSTGGFAVPSSVDRVGWYRYGPGLEADAGSIVIAGHVDSATMGRGAFFRLRELEPGDPITVTGQDGMSYDFRVVGREEYQKTQIPLDRYFARDGAPRLTLITCGGPFDEAARHYRDNIVVTAVRA